MSQNADRRFAPNAVAARSAMRAVLLGIAFLPGCTSASALDEASPGATPYYGYGGDEPGGAEDGVARGPDAMPGLGSDATPERGPEPGTLTPGTLRPPASGRRMVRDEYLNTVGDLFAIDTEPLRDILIADGGASGFRNAFTALLPSGPRTDAFEQAAIYVAGAVPTATLTRYGACQQAAEPCTSDFVAALGRVLYRRPLVEREVSNLVGLFSVATDAGDDFETGSRLVLQAMLQSPSFLYRLERIDRVDPATGLASVDGYEYLSRLSFLFWQSAPDTALLDAVDRNGIEAARGAVAAMLQSPKARRGITAIVDEWLALYKLENTDRDRDVFPEFSPELLAAMRAETLVFFERLVFDERASFMTAFTKQTSTFGPELAPIYGVEHDPAGQDWSAVATRGGFLTQAGLLTAHTVVDETSIIARGLFVLRKLLCRDVPPPPPNAAAGFASVDPTLPQRERFAQHRTDPACGGCHATFDPLGFPFEAYDALGRFNTADAYGNPIEVGGTVTLDGAERSYANLVEFSALLAESETAQNCIVRQATEYAFGRALESQDAAFVASLSDAFREGDRDFLGLVQKVALSSPFLHVPLDQTPETTP